MIYNNLEKRSNMKELEIYAKENKIPIMQKDGILYLINYINPSNIYIGLPNENGIATFSKIKDKHINRLMNDANDMDLNVGDYLFDLMSSIHQSSQFHLNLFPFECFVAFDSFHFECFHLQFGQ